MPCRFIQIPIELINYVKAKKLSGLQYSLWLFLYSLDPFGDRFVPIPSPEQIASELNVCARSIQRAAQRLADLDLFDFNVNTWCAKNTTINKNSKQRTKNQEGDQLLRNRGGLNNNLLIGKKQDGSIKTPSISTSSLGFGDKSCLSNINNINSSLPDFLRPSRQRTKRSKCGHSDPNVETQTKRSSKGQKDPIDSPKTVHSKQSTASQTNTDKLDLSYKRDKSDLSSKQINNQEPDLEVDFWVEDNIDNSTSLPNQDLKEGSNWGLVELKIKERREPGEPTHNEPSIGCGGYKKVSHNCSAFTK